MKRKDVTGLKPVTGQEAAGASEPGLSGQQLPSHQVAAQPAIIDIEESAEELDGGEEQGKILLCHRNVT